MYKYFNLLNNKVTPVICEKVLHCFGHGKKQRVCGSTQVFPCTQNSTLLHEAQALLAPFKQYFCLSCSIRGAHKGH